MFLIKMEMFLQEKYGKIRTRKNSVFGHFSRSVTLPVPIPGKRKKVTQIFIFTLLCDASRGFMKALKTFIKCIEELVRSVKKNFS